MEPQKHYSVVEQEMVIGLYRESGKTQREFCRSEGLEPKKLERWLRAQKARQEGPAKEMSFVEVEESPKAKRPETVVKYRLGFGSEAWLPTKADHRGHVWTWDFISDATTRDGALRMLTILDEYTRECHVLRADRALKSADVLQWMGKAIAEHGEPEYLRSDNGPEFIAREVQRWLAAHQIKTIYIEPASPWLNGFVGLLKKSTSGTKNAIISK